MAVIGIGSAIHAQSHRFERDASLSLWTVAWLRRGHATFTTAQGRCRLGPARLIAIAPRTAYVVESPGAHETWWFVAPPVTFPDLALIVPGIRSGRFLDPRMRRAVRDLDRSTTRALRENAWQRIQLVMRSEEGSHPAVRAAIAHMREHMGSVHALATLSAAVGCSRSRLAEVFTQEVGLPPMAWLERERMDQAKRLLLASDLGIGEIADRLGYPNAFHFSTRFKRHTGLPPSQWRQAPG
jgi:AraC-like DNA-binding protein